MKNDNGKNEINLLACTCNSFKEKYKKLLKKAQSLKQDSNTQTKKENNIILKKETINKYKLQTMSKLPMIKNIRKNYNFIQYIQNINNNTKLNAQSPKNHLFFFDTFLKNGKKYYINKKHGNKSNNSYTKFPKEHKSKNNSLNNFNLNNINNNSKYVLDGNSPTNNINPDLNNSNFNIEKEENKNKLKGNNIQYIISLRKNIELKNNKYSNKNKSTKHFNIKKINIYNIKNEKKIKINIIKRNDKTQLIKVPKKFFNSDNIKDTINNNSNSNIYLNELKHSNSYKNFTLTKNNLNFNIKQGIDDNYLSANNTNKKYFIIYPGNNGKLVEKVILTRPNWENLPESKKKGECNLLWTPLSNQINYSFHKTIDEFHIINHFEYQNELSNKRNIFINLLKYSEINNVNLFSFYPLTIILPLNNDNFNTAIENFKKCYFDLPNLVEDPENKNTNFLDKYYRNYFHVKSNLKLGSIQKLIIPKSHYARKNLWLIKRINLNRGRQIKIFNNLEELLFEILLIKNEQKVKYILIQKYIEKPLLYCGRKFDIRIWVLFTYMLKTNRFDAYVFREGHLKASSELFDINSLDTFIHLTNYSVQKYNKNFSKSEIGNEISFSTFQKELDKNTYGKINFKNDIFGKIVKIIEITANIAKNKINSNNRKNCFEIFGYDFILDEDYNPFLLEINTNPGYEESSPLIKMLVPRMIDDALRLTIDKTFERNDKYKKSSQFPVDDYKDEENMWQKIKL